MNAIFPLGQLCATPAALRLLDDNHIDCFGLIHRHANGDFGDLCREDLQANEEALREGFRIFSSYVINGEGDKVWIITEADRSVTTVLLPEDY